MVVDVEEEDNNDNNHNIFSSIGALEMAMSVGLSVGPSVRDK